MTVREALTFTDAMARLRAWRKNQRELVYEARRRTELWKHRAQVQAERAERAERKLRQLERGPDDLADALRDPVRDFRELGTEHFLGEYADRLEKTGFPVHAQEIRKALALVDAARAALERHTRKADT